MHFMVPVLLAVFVIGCPSEDAESEGNESEAEWSLRLEGSFATEGLVQGRGDMLVSLFPEEGDGLIVTSFAYQDGYLFRGSHVGNYATAWSGTAGPLSGVFNITIPSRFTEPTIVLAWADSQPFGTFDVRAERSETEWNSLLRLSNGDILGPIRFDGNRVFYVTWIAHDPENGPHKVERELTADLYTQLTLAHAWTDPL